MPLFAVSKRVPFHVVTPQRLRHVCLEIVWLKLNSCGRKSFELSVQSPNLALGREFEDNEHSFEKNGHPLLSA